MRVLAVIDGEHHPSVARDALDRLAAEHDVAGVVLAGGGEKLSSSVVADPTRHYGREVSTGPPEAALRDLAGRVDPEAVVDLSGEPVLGGRARFELASLALALGLEYRAPGLELRPPPQEPLDFTGPVVAVVGTGKRTGKTAVAGHLAMLLRRRGVEPVLVAMGRGGPPQPELVTADERPSLDQLLAIARAGRHAASDYLEDAVLAEVTTVGCRRCGEGPAGEPYDDNVAAGARLAVEQRPDAILLEGSGAALPPLRADRTICITTASHADEQALSHLGPYRLLRSQAVIVTGADALAAEELRALEQAIARWCPGPVIASTFAPEPAAPVAPGTRAALFTTAAEDRAPALARALAEPGIELAVVSTALARRDELAGDLDRAVAAGCELFLTELKAAAIEVVAERAEREGIPLTFIRNRPVALAGARDLDAVLTDVYEEACALAREREPAGAARP